MFDSLYTLLSEKSAIPFVEYMQHALYAPDGGYYSSRRTKFGKEGDFITAPELSPLFGQTLARQCQQILETLSQPNDILEFGAGSGRLCIDVLQELERQDCLPDHYYILEVSGGLRDLQQANIHQEIPQLAERVVWIERWPEEFVGVILANEVLDAMPVHRFLKTEEGLRESWVCLDSAGGLCEEYRSEIHPALKAYVQTRLVDLPCPYQSEVNLLAGAWVRELADVLSKGVVLLFDYGFPRHEYYHPDRRMGTLMCHYQHQSHPEPLQHPGEQDITAHVDFTLIAEEAFDAGLHVAGFTNQASFLLANGLLSLLDTNAPTIVDVKQKQAVKQLTHPHEMGELFKVMALSKGIELDLQGFILSDKRASL